MCQTNPPGILKFCLPLRIIWCSQGGIFFLPFYLHVQRTKFKEAIPLSIITWWQFCRVFYWANWFGNIKQAMNAVDPFEHWLCFVGVVVSGECPLMPLFRHAFSLKFKILIKFYRFVWNKLRTSAEFTWAWSSLVWTSLTNLQLTGFLMSIVQGSIRLFRIYSHEWSVTTICLSQISLA